AALDALNQIVHPAVRRRREELLRAAREGGDLLVVNDIPLLFEALDPAQFDAVVLVDAGVALRRTRLRAMRGLSNDEADRMIAAQMPAERKRAKSDVVIENEGSLEQLERQARAAFDELRHRAAVAALGGRPARVLLLAAAGAREQPTLNPIAARYADAGLAVRRVTGDAAAIERALGQPATPDAIVATAAAAAAAEQAWADGGRPVDSQRCRDRACAGQAPADRRNRLVRGSRGGGRAGVGGRRSSGRADVPLGGPRPHRGAARSPALGRRAGAPGRARCGRPGAP